MALSGHRRGGHCEVTVLLQPTVPSEVTVLLQPTVPSGVPIPASLKTALLC